MALGVPNSGAFGTPAPRAASTSSAGLRAPRPPMNANLGTSRAARGFNQSGMSFARPDRMGQRPGGIFPGRGATGGVFPGRGPIGGMFPGRGPRSDHMIGPGMPRKPLPWGEVPTSWPRKVPGEIIGYPGSGPIMAPGWPRKPGQPGGMIPRPMPPQTKPWPGPTPPFNPYPRPGGGYDGGGINPGGDFYNGRPVTNPLVPRPGMIQLDPREWDGTFNNMAYAQMPPR